MMIGFEEDAEMLGSYGRFHVRLNKFKYYHDSFPKARHHFWWVFHNCIAHPLIGIMPTKKTFALHDWTSKKLNLL